MQRATLPATEGKVLIELVAVCHLASLSDTTIRTLIDKKRFPAGFKVGDSPNSPRRWVRAEVVAFLEGGMLHRDAAEVAPGG
jgi:predicted DNA-binding transcriptional regulator AlpA